MATSMAQLMNTFNSGFSALDKAKKDEESLKKVVSTPPKKQQKQAVNLA
jgi:hypothetical protein